MKIMRPKIAMLLRLSFLEPTKKRGSFLSWFPPHKIIVLPRISFTDDGKTDSVTCLCLDKPHFTYSYAPLFRAILNYLKGNYEAIMPLVESKRMADEAFEKLFSRGTE